MCKFLLAGCLQTICNFFFAKLVQFLSFCQRLSKKLNFIKIWQVKVGQNKDLVSYRKKQSFRQCAWGLRQLVLKPGFRPLGELWVWRKSQKISTASDQYFLSYVKKLKIDPPPAGIGLKDVPRPKRLYSTNVWITPAVWKQKNKMANLHFSSKLHSIYSILFEFIWLKLQKKTTFR